MHNTMTTGVTRRTLATAVAWSTPAIALGTAAPALASSTDTPQTYGALVVAPWSGSPTLRTWKGKTPLETKWVYFPTTRPGSAVSLSSENTAAEIFATPLANGGTAAWPTNFPAGGDAKPNVYDTTGATYPYPENLTGGGLHR